MTDRDDRITITLIPVDRIRVLNPRERDRKRFQEIVDSIRNVGLKQPIKVTRLNGSGGEAEYGRTMSGKQLDSSTVASGAANRLLAEAAHLQAIEGNPLTAEEIAMFEMFAREGWSPERRRAHILRQIKDRGRVAAAE